jgi:hypothetical protein
MMAGVITAAIMALAPGKVAGAVVLYTTAIVQATEVRGIDPLLVVSIIHVETGGRWESDMISPTHDYGLMQPHVSKTTNKEFLGREEELLDLVTNIEVGVNMLTSWKEYHSKHCKGNSHRWWAHYKWGVEVKNNKYGRKVLRVYSRVKRRVHLLCALGGTHDHSCGRVGCQWQEYTDQSSRKVVASIPKNFVPALRWSVWASDQEAFNGASSSVREKFPYIPRTREMGAVSRRRRRFPSFDDNGQVRCCV